MTESIGPAARKGMLAGARGMLGPPLGMHQQVLQRRLRVDGGLAVVLHVLLAARPPFPPDEPRRAAHRPDEAARGDGVAGGGIDRAGRSRPGDGDHRALGDRAGTGQLRDHPVGAGAGVRRHDVVRPGPDGTEQDLGGEARPTPQPASRLPRQADLLVRHRGDGGVPAARVADREHGPQRGRNARLGSCSARRRSCWTSWARS